MDVDVTFDDDIVKMTFLGYEVWVRRLPEDKDVDAAITRAVVNTFRGSPTPIRADWMETVQEVLKAVHGHRDFPVWEVQSA